MKDLSNKCLIYITLCVGARLVPSQDFEGKKNLRACDWFTDKTNTILIGRDRSANITKQ